MGCGSMQLLQSQIIGWTYEETRDIFSECDILQSPAETQSVVTENICNCELIEKY
jgi:hypothetical protein